MFLHQPDYSRTVADLNLILLPNLTSTQNLWREELPLKPALLHTFGGCALNPCTQRDLVHTKTRSIPPALAART
jgi:hypothetical protein